MITIIGYSSRLELKGKSGIYCIRNRTNGKVYVGSSVDFAMRIKAHVNCLDGNRHHTQALQNAWNKYGRENFEIELLEFTERTKKVLIEREQHYIDSLNAYGKGGYNSRPRAESRLGTKASEETKAKMSAVRRGKPKNGLKAAGPDNIDGIEYEFRSPDGTIHKGRNLQWFANQHGLYYSSMRRILTGETISHRGWTLPNPRVNKLKAAQVEFCLISPTGEVYKGRNVKQFCEQYGLDASSIQLLVRGKRISHKGWRTPETLNAKPRLTCKSYIAVDPSGKTWKITNLCAFCKEHGLDASAMIRTLDGRQTNHKGWTAPRKETTFGKQLSLFDLDAL